MTPGIVLERFSSRHHPQGEEKGERNCFSSRIGFRGNGRNDVGKCRRIFKQMEAVDRNPIFSDGWRTQDRFAQAPRPESRTPHVVIYLRYVPVSPHILSCLVTREIRIRTQVGRYLQIQVSFPRPPAMSAQGGLKETMAVMWSYVLSPFCLLPSPYLNRAIYPSLSAGERPLNHGVARQVPEQPYVGIDADPSPADKLDLESGICRPNPMYLHPTDVVLSIPGGFKALPFDCISPTPRISSNLYFATASPLSGLAITEQSIGIRCGG